MRLALVIILASARIGSASIASAETDACEDFHPISEIGMLKGLWTSDTKDHTPPAAPGNLKVHIEVEHWRPETIYLRGSYARETAFIVVRVDEPGGGYFAIATPGQSKLCGRRETTPASSDIWVSVTAYGRAGNASPSVYTLAHVHFVPMNCIGPMIYLPALFLAAALLGLLRLLRVGRTPEQQPYDHARAAVLVADILRSHTKLFAVTIVGAVGVCVLDSSFLMIGPFVVIALAIHVGIDVVNAYRMKWELDHGHRYAERRGNWLRVGTVQLPMSPRAWDRAAIPAASANLQRRD